MTRSGSALLGLVILGTSLGGTASRHAAATNDQFPPDLPSECTIENVAGVFGFNEDTLSGTVTQQPIAFVGILDLRPDGTAGIRFRAFVQRGGPLVSTNEFEGEWAVAPNCVGFIDFETFVSPRGQGDSDYQFVAAENGTELFFIRNNPLEAGDAKLLFRR